MEISMSFTIIASFTNLKNNKLIIKEPEQLQWLCDVFIVDTKRAFFSKDFSEVTIYLEEFLFVVKTWNCTERYSSKDLALRIKCIKIFSDIMLKRSI